MHPHIEIILKAHSVPFTVRRHADLPVRVASPTDFARALGYGIERITKTLFLRSAKRQQYALVVASVDKKIDLKAVARSLGCSRFELASREELKRLVGYPPTGVSPIGTKGFPVVMDSTLLTLKTVIVGGGIVGIEIELSPADLQRVTNATVRVLA